MNFFNYFYKSGILDIEEIILLPLNTYTRPDNTIEYDIPNNDDSPLDNYYYIFGGYIEDYGIDLIGNLDDSSRILSNHHDYIYLEKKY